MAIEHAKAFVNNFFEDDEFTKTVIRKRGFSRNEENSESMQNEKMVEVANEMGFNFDATEYIDACKEYMNELGGWESAKKVFHIVSIAVNISKESDKE